MSTKSFYLIKSNQAQSNGRRERTISLNLLRRQRRTRVNAINSETGETKTVEVSESNKSFFNFLSNIRLPSEEEIKKIDYELVKSFNIGKRVR
jgi:hypothetical protein